MTDNKGDNHLENIINSTRALELNRLVVKLHAAFDHEGEVSLTDVLKLVEDRIQELE